MQQGSEEPKRGETAAHEHQEGFGGEPHQPYAIFRHRDYLLYTLARNIAVIGLRMSALAVGWQLYTRTKDPLTLGYVGLVQFLPVLLLAIPAGHAADRFSRKAIVQSSQLVMIAAALGLAAISAFRAPLPLVYLCLLVASLASGFSGPARSAMLPHLVPLPDYEAAIRWSSGMFQVASMLGPALGGAVIGMSGGSVTSVYLLDALCGVIAFFLTAATVMRYGSAPRREPLTLESLTAGLRFVWRTRIILATITLHLFAVLLGGAVTLLPIYATDILQVGASGLGWLEAAPSAGALCMAAALTHLPPLRRPGVAMLWAVAGFGLATIVFGFSRSFELSLVMLFLTGALDNISVVVRSTLVQVLTPNEMLGRVSAVNNVFISTSNQIGGFESGLVARLFGPVISVVSGGIGTLLVVAAVALRWPEVLRFRSGPAGGARNEAPETAAPLQEAPAAAE